MAGHDAGADDGEQQPLLRDASGPLLVGPDDNKYDTIATLSETENAAGQVHPSRAVEDDVLPETSTLGRTLSWQSAYILVISRVVGSGIFATPGAILQSVGSPGLALLLWIVGTLVAAAGLAVSLEYGCMLPRSGGVKVYLEFTYRYPRLFATTQVAINAVFLGFTASNCVIFSRYVLFAYGVENASAFAAKGLAVALLVAVTAIHAVTPKAGVKIQDFLGWVKVGIVVFMIFAGLYVVVFQPTLDTSLQRNPLSWDHLWDDSVWNWGIISTSLFKVFYAYAGLDNVSNVLNEVKDPVRTLRSVTLTALVTSCAMYTLINVAYFIVVPIDEIKGSGELIAALFFQRVFGEQVGRRILPLAVALSAVGNVFVVAFAMARLKQEIARQGFLPFSDILASTKPFNSPFGGLIVNFIPSFLVIVLPPTTESYSFILEVEGYPGQVFTLAMGVGLVWLRFKRPDIRRPYKAWLPAVILRILLSIALLAAPFFPPKEKPSGGLWYATYAVVGMGTIVAGVLYWYVWTVLLPKWGGYTLEEKTEVLDDGTSITRVRPVDAHQVIIKDVAGEESKYTLDKNGFQIHRHTSVEKDFLDDEQIKAVYYPETEQLLKDVTGASKIFIFDHTIRRTSANDNTSRGPVQRVHIDQSYSAALSRVPYHLPEQADELLKGRVEIINVWRPIKQILRDPLAIAEADSVAEEDLVPVGLIYPTRNGETLSVRYNKNHRWYYKSGLTPEEVILIKCFDSKTDGRARRVPHTAFSDASSPADAPARESIEVRALVFHEDDRE
ncbi:amino acid permease domain-containing protein [Trichoderma gracile]